MSGNQPTGVTLTPTAPLRFILARLDIGTRGQNLFSDTDVLGFLNDAQNELCEKSRWLRAVDSFTFQPGVAEYSLPALCCEVLRVYVNGTRLRPVSLDQAMAGLSGPFYYQVEGVIGFVNAPTAPGSFWVYYAKRPLLMGWDDTPVIPPEFHYLLRHYAAWRILIRQSGVGGLPEAIRQRGLFDAGIHKLRSETIRESQPRRLPVAGGIGAR